MELRSFRSFVAVHEAHFQVLPQTEKDRIIRQGLFKMSKRLLPSTSFLVPVSFQDPITSLVSVSNNILPSIPEDISDSVQVLVYIQVQVPTILLMFHQFTL